MHGDLTALLPVLQIFGTEYKDRRIVTWLDNEEYHYDAFTKIDFCYADSVASVKVGQGVKSEGELIISGTKGYIYVPAPWWKTEYFEVRYENPEIIVDIFISWMEKGFVMNWFLSYVQ